MKNLSEDLKRIIAWLAAATSLVATLAAVRSSGFMSIAFAAITLLLLAVVVRWRSFLNEIRKRETIHTVEILNPQGDAIYRRATSFLPLLWAVRKTEVFISLSAEGGRISSASVNWPVVWKEQTPRRWKGEIILPPHRPRLLSFGRPAGFRVEFMAEWQRAFGTPPFDFVVATGERPSSKIEIRLLWRTGAKPCEARAEFAAYPVESVRTEGMLDTTRIPWANHAAVLENLGEVAALTCSIEGARPNYLYRVVWRY